MAKGVIGSDLHFYPRPPGGGRPERATHFCCYPRFLSTPSGWRATSVKSGSSSCEIFLSTPSGWRATFVHIKFLRSFYSISIHALRVEGDPEVGHIVKTIGISIHALRVEGDDLSIYLWYNLIDFYPRPPGGGRLVTLRKLCKQVIFLSTPSGWRATPALSGSVGLTLISIHALRVEGDLPPSHYEPFGSLFLSTPSGWRATAKTDKVFVCFCAKGRRICLFKTRKEKNLPVAF